MTTFRVGDWVVSENPYLSQNRGNHIKGLVIEVLPREERLIVAWYRRNGTLVGATNYSVRDMTNFRKTKG